MPPKKASCVNDISKASLTRLLGKGDHSNKCVSLTQAVDHVVKQCTTIAEWYRMYTVLPSHVDKAMRKKASGTTILAHAPMVRLIRSVSRNYRVHTRFSAQALKSMHIHIENIAKKIHSNEIVEHASRTKPIEYYFDSDLKKVKSDITDMRMSKNAMKEINSSLSAIASMIMDYISGVDYSKTVSARNVQGAVRLTLEKELAKHAVSEGTKAITVYMSSDGGKKGKPMSRSKQAKLYFSVSKVEKIMRHRFPRISQGAPVYFAAVLEYLAGEMIDFAANVAASRKAKTIQNNNVIMAKKRDQDFDHMMDGVGYVPVKLR